MNAGIERHRYERLWAFVAAFVSASVHTRIVATGVNSRIISTGIHTCIVATGVHSRVVSTGVYTRVIPASVRVLCGTGVVTSHRVAVTGVGGSITGAVPAGRDNQAQK